MEIDLRGLRELRLARLGGGEPAESLQSILLAALEERPETRHLVLARGDHEFAARIMNDAPRPAVRVHLREAGAHEAGASGAGLVVEPAVEHAAVARALVRPEARFLLHHREFGAWILGAQRARGAKSHEATADHEDFRLMRHA